RLEIGLVVGHSPSEDRLTGLVENVSEVLVLADVQPDPHGHLVGCGHPVSSRFNDHEQREGRPGRARRHPPYEPAICRMSPSEVHAPDRTGGNTPQAINVTGGHKPYRHRRTSQALSMTAQNPPGR